jgi:hypothetical protein
VTRTWHFGTPNAEEKRAFTRVLQGHIAIDKAIFPTGTTGKLLVCDRRQAEPSGDAGFIMCAAEATVLLTYKTDGLNS